jgi:signal peptidase I
MNNFLNGAKDFVAEWSVTILILLFGTTTIMQAFVVPTSSMESTVLVGDHLIVDKLSYSEYGSISKHLLPYTDIKRGDIIVFKFPPQPTMNYIKRAMGLPGDHIRVENKVVIINGRRLTDEPYTQHIDPNIAPYRDNFPSTPVNVWQYTDRVTDMLEHHVDRATNEVVVPPDSFFAMGDNRDNSLDSRYWGFVPRDNIIGKPFVIFWSYDTNTENLVDFRMEHFVDLAEHFFTKTRWDRTLKLVRGVEIK